MDRLYKNPIIPLDYSDPDVIRVEKGDESHYYCVASSFMDVPGVPVLHSKDLMHWEIAGYAISDFFYELEHYSPERMDWYEYGVYAPSIRFHQGIFYVYIPIYPDGGICVSTAERAEGPWKTEWIRDKNGRKISFPQCRLTDVCPFWDDDGKAYLILSNLESRELGVMWQSQPDTVPGSSAQLFEMSADGKVLLDADASSPASFAKSGVCVRNIFCTEGNKIYKKDGWYYILNVCFAGNSPNGRGMYIRRAKSIYGDGGVATLPDGFRHAGNYEMKFLGAPEQIPTQGAFVFTSDGRWFFVGQMPDDSAGGRMVHLVPVSWEEGEFPSLQMTERYPMPFFVDDDKKLVGSDDFRSGCLKPWWNWNHVPDERFYRMTDAGLRIYARKRIPCGCKSNTIWGIRNVLFQKYISASRVEFSVCIDLKDMEEGQEAGLVHFNGGDEFVSFYVRYTNGKKYLCLDASKREMRECREEHKLQKAQPPYVLNPDKPALGEADEARVIAEINEDIIRLKTLVLQENGGIGEEGNFFYEVNGELHFAGNAQLPESGRFRGNRIGLFTCNDMSEKGYVEFKDVVYEFKTVQY